MWTTQGWYSEAFRCAVQNAENTRALAEFLLLNYEKGIPDLSRQEIVQQLQTSSRERLDAVPNLAKYPELRGMRDLVEAAWKGTRDGAQMSDEQWAASCDANFYYHRYVCIRLGSVSGEGTGNGRVF